MVKKIFFAASLIGFSVSLHAQLTVKDNSYIYASDEVIFVEDDINLVSTNSNLYLRDEAQLIQGEGTTGNSGNGNLSIFQRGTVNGYAYNFWCSPVGQTTGASNGNTPFLASLIDKPTGKTSSDNVTFINSYDGTANPFQISKKWIYTFSSSADYSGWSYKGNSNNINSGLGFSMKGVNGENTTIVYDDIILNPENNQLYDFRGRPNNGTISNDIIANSQTLIGNPYPSGIDALQFIHDSENESVITGYLHYWEQAPGANSHNLADYAGGYATYTIDIGGAETFVHATFYSYNGSGEVIDEPQGTGTKVARRYIPVGQGFFVEGKSDIVGTGQVKMKNSFRAYVKESSGDSYFFRTASPGHESQTQSVNSSQTSSDSGFGIIPDTYKRFRLNIIFNNTYTRQLVHNFHANATDGFDYGLEGKSPGGVSSDAYWILNNEPYVIQAHNFTSDLTIPLIVNIDQPQNVNINILDIQHFPDTQAIYLHDTYTGTYTNLRLQDFSTYLEQGEYTDRFEITFQQDSTLNNAEIPSETLNIFQNNRQSELTILNPNGLNVKEIQLFDMAGKLILRNSNMNASNSYKLPTNHLSDGTYVASIILGNNQTINKKVVISNNN
ncbi:T9SS sorting signal type C domain-containing protein [Mangrovimonas aestuarii]|uniref:T9SS sorting signal type C domain-containing protein n=1 Tax=Mangrovimonas aestuarii TaxID=3018443 RepID=UPI0023790500|nr:T9SS sorting signal type C domain-containing protein [Mangrovimonas aestuarii]